jgi:hypothetical protein
MDDDGNPTGFSIHKLEFPMYFSGPGDLEFVSEEIGGYLIKSTVFVKDATYTRTISGLVATDNAKGIASLLKTFETEAIAKGASTIVIRGTKVANAGFTAIRAQRFGYVFKEIDKFTFEITKTLK